MFYEDDMDSCATNCLCENIECSFQKGEKTCNDVTAVQKEICPKISEICSDENRSVCSKILPYLDPMVLLYDLVEDSVCPIVKASSPEEREIFESDLTDEQIDLCLEWFKNCSE